MRFAVGVLLCLNFGAVSVALADPPPTPSAPTTAAPTAPAAAAPANTATPASAAKAATAPAAIAPAATAPDIHPLEKHFLAEGYKMEMRNGVKVFCRREEVLGSRLGAGKVCATAHQLELTEAQAREGVEHVQQNTPPGRGN